MELITIEDVGDFDNNEDDEDEDIIEIKDEDDHI